MPRALPNIAISGITPYLRCKPPKVSRKPEVHSSNINTNISSKKILNSGIIKNKDSKNILGIRPEDIYLTKRESLDFEFEAEVIHIAYHGQEVELIAKSDLGLGEISIKADKSFHNIEKNSKISCFCNTNSFKIY